MSSEGVIVRTLQISSASISFIASSVIAVMIKRAPRGLSTPYRRILFGLSISDILQSFALLTGPFAVPKGTTQSPWGIGTNVRLCEANGFSMIFGTAAVPMYTCFLCLYYLCKLKHKMTDEAFTLKVERKLHVGIIAWNLTACTFLLITKRINPFRRKHLPYFCFPCRLQEVPGKVWRMHPWAELLYLCGGLDGLNPAH